MTIKERLKELGLVLPPIPQPGGNYVDVVRTGNLMFLSGKGPVLEGGRLATGKVGQDVTREEAYQHARRVGLLLLSAVEKELGELDKVTRIIKVLGMVNAVPDFGDQPEVINGCSDLFVEVLGEKGRHARSAVGMGSLPKNITVEIEAIFEVE